jgi:hypothetical protein
MIFVDEAHEACNALLTEHIDSVEDKQRLAKSLRSGSYSRLRRRVRKLALDLRPSTSCDP